MRRHWWRLFIKSNFFWLVCQQNIFITVVLTCRFEVSFKNFLHMAIVFVSVNNVINIPLLISNLGIIRRISPNIINNIFILMDPLF